MSADRERQDSMRDALALIIAYHDHDREGVETILRHGDHEVIIWALVGIASTLTAQIGDNPSDRARWLLEHWAVPS